MPADTSGGLADRTPTLDMFECSLRVSKKKGYFARVTIRVLEGFPQRALYIKGTVVWGPYNEDPTI